MVMVMVVPNMRDTSLEVSLPYANMLKRIVPKVT